MPPSSIENSLAGLVELMPEQQEELLTLVDQPLTLAMDTKMNRPFIKCDYNRDGDSHRSPWSNAYYPPPPSDQAPLQISATLRKLEMEANDVFDVYRKLYFEGGVSSVYFFSTTNAEGQDAKAFGACFLIHKDVDNKKEVEQGWWDSTHVFDVSESKKGYFDYKLTTTVMVSLGVKNGKVGEVDLSGSMTQQETRTLQVSDANPHLVNLGTMLEAMETKIRNMIEGVYIQKTHEIINGMRTINAQKQKEWERVTQSLQQAVSAHGSSRKKDSE